MAAPGSTPNLIRRLPRRRHLRLVHHLLFRMTLAARFKDLRQRIRLIFRACRSYLSRFVFLAPSLQLDFLNANSATRMYQTRLFLFDFFDERLRNGGAGVNFQNDQTASSASPSPPCSAFLVRRLYGRFGSCQSIKQCWHCCARAVIRSPPQYGQGAVSPTRSGMPE
jgi:hypothetical protein